MLPLVLLSLLGAAAAVPAAAPTNEASEAAITDPFQECTPYDYPPVDALSASYPPNWVQPAVIVAGDAAANALWAQIKPSIPTDIAPRGTVQGDFSGVNYPSSDPDCWWTYEQCTTPKLAGLAPDITGVPEPNTLGYGFDDGPNCSHNAFYDYLSGQNQKATMFYIGSNVQNWPLQAQRAISDGHEICVHTWSHPYMTAVDSEGAFAELYYAREMIRAVTGVTPKCWRPPYGDVDDRIRSIAAALNLTTIVWSYDSFDYNGPSVQAEVDQNYENLIARAKNGTFANAGTIMLTHELTNFTMQTAVDYYAQLKGAFAHLVPVGVGMNWTQPCGGTDDRERGERRLLLLLLLFRRSLIFVLGKQHKRRFGGDDREQQQQAERQRGGRVELRRGARARGRGRVGGGAERGARVRGGAGCASLGRVLRRLALFVHVTAIRR
ncbi:hypothetical protein HWV62_11373 [Athelia sp. TMB]|nr:hypothetical protein HWV62_11373 [Athelia sp. TMB]